MWTMVAQAAATTAPEREPCIVGVVYNPPEKSTVLWYWKRRNSGERYTTHDTPLGLYPNLCTSTDMDVTPASW
jgi:hypothetical protein